MGTCRKLRFIQIKILAIWLKWGKWGKHLFAILTTLYLQIANKLWITNFIKMVSIKPDGCICFSLPIMCQTDLQLMVADGTYRYHPLLGFKRSFFFSSSQFRFCFLPFLSRKSFWIEMSRLKHHWSKFLFWICNSQN